jgi:mRNA-degrading endonuclease HigB of HigAB toxin-antitoxin module
MSTKEKAELKALVQTIEAKEQKESNEIKTLSTETFKLKNENKMVQ